MGASLGPVEGTGTPYAFADVQGWGAFGPHSAGVASSEGVSPDWVAMLYAGLVGDEAAEPTPESPNFVKAQTFGRVDVLAMVLGGSSDETAFLTLWGGATRSGMPSTCVTVLAKNEAEITLREWGGMDAYTFPISDTSDVSWRLVPRTTVEVEFFAAARPAPTEAVPEFVGHAVPADYIRIDFADPSDPDPSCGSAAPSDAGELPDTAMGRSGVTTSVLLALGSIVAVAASVVAARRRV
jgi:hypothetical protein